MQRALLEYNKNKRNYIKKSGTISRSLLKRSESES